MTVFPKIRHELLRDIFAFGVCIEFVWVLIHGGTVPHPLTGISALRYIYSLNQTRAALCNSIICLRSM